MSTEKVFLAKFTGKCQKCNKKIFIGDDIVAWKSSTSMDDIASIIGKYNALDVKKFLPKQTCWCHALCNKNSVEPLRELRTSAWDRPNPASANEAANRPRNPCSLSCVTRPDEAYQVTYEPVLPGPNIRNNSPPT
jgi:hypothetical protein